MGQLPSTRLNRDAWRKVSYKAQSPRSRHSSCAPTTLLQAAIWESHSHSRLRQILTWPNSPRSHDSKSASTFVLALCPGIIAMNSHPSSTEGLVITGRLEHLFRESFLIVY